MTTVTGSDRTIISNTAVITTFFEGQPRGITTHLVMDLSQDPKLVLATLPRTSRATRFLNDSTFAINVLNPVEEAIIAQFTGPFGGQETEFEARQWHLTGEIPIFKQAQQILFCRTWNIYDGGDHHIIVGEVQPD